MPPPTIRNPAVNLLTVLGTDLATYTAAKTALQTFFQANIDKQYVDEALARALHPLWANDRIWAHVKAELGL